MNSLRGWYAGLLTLAMIAGLVVTPETLDRWVEEADWEYYASPFTD